MTPLDGPITTDPRMRVEELFVALLEADPALADLSIVEGSNRDALVPPLHCFVYCREIAPVLAVGQNYRAEVSIVVASNIDDNDHTDRKAFAKGVLACLTRQEPGIAGHAYDARLIHWRITGITEVSQGQNAGDRIDLAVVVWVAAES
jgi:hypothetical protein